MSTLVTSASWFDGNPKTGRYVLTQDITIDSDTYVELSGNTAEFDGNGHTITIHDVTDFHGLFKLTDGATVKNVTVDVDNATSTLWGDSDNYSAAGWIVQHDSSGNVLTCNSNGDANTEYGGCVVGSYFMGTISECTSTGNVRRSYAGGVVGAVLGKSMNDVTVHSLVNRCQMYGNIVIGADNGGALRMGGIVGYRTSGATISRCVMLGNIVQSGVGGVGVVGGIVAGIYGEDILQVQQCYSTCDMTAPGSGGIIGEGGALLEDDTYVVNISECFATGAISARICGGIMGSGAASLSACFTTGNIGVETAQLEHSAAGIVGAVDSASITDCYSAGDVIGPHCGGLIGTILDNSRPTTVTNCYAAGSLTDVSLNADYEYDGVPDGVSCAGVTALIYNKFPTLSNVYVTGGKRWYFVTDLDTGSIDVDINAGANVSDLVGDLGNQWSADVWSVVPGGYPVLKAFTQSPWTGYTVYTDAPTFGTPVVRLYAMTHPVSLFYESVRLLGQNGQLIAVFEQSRKPGLQGCRASEVSLRSSAAPMERGLVQRGDPRKTASLKVWAAMRAGGASGGKM